MKTKILLLMALVMVALQGWAAPVDLKKAQMVAQSFANANTGYMAPLGHNGLKLAHVEQSGEFADQPVFYVFNSEDGFIIVSGDDRADDILAYGEGTFDINDIPEGLRDLLDCYKEEIEYLQTNPMLEVKKVCQERPSLNASSVAPLLRTKWNQNAPFWNKCKFKKVLTSTEYQCYTGCGATAMAQIMYYWKYPSSYPSLSGYTGALHGMVVPYLPSKTISWNSMKNYYGTYWNDKGVKCYSSYTTTQADAVATLMRYVGQAFHTDYNDNGSAVYFNSTVKNTMVNKFGYSSSVQLIAKSSTNSSYWNTWIKNELNCKRPVFYNAQGSGGHYFIIDGYNASGSYHINWGWGGYYDGYYKLGAFNPGSSNYNSSHQMLLDLRPKTVVTTNPASLTFSSKQVNRTYTATFIVKGYHLAENDYLSLKLSGAIDVFQINKTTISKSASEQGAEVTVTYAPKATGKKIATVTISGGGLTTNKTVKLIGTAVKSGNNNNNGTTIVNLIDNLNDFTADTKISVDGLTIVVDSPVDQKAIVSDISGHARYVNIQEGRNEIPVNAGGLYIVRVGEKSVKLMLR